MKTYLRIATIVLVAVFPHDQTRAPDPILSELASVYRACHIALMDAEWELENVQYPGIPDDYLERMTYTVRAERELTRLDKMLREETRASNNVRALASIHLKIASQKMREITAEMAVVGAKEGIIDTASKVMSRLREMGLLADPLAPASCPG